ncbi:MAG: STAS domain-containing protein [Planctomycetales bacterium]|nr:STAS domain-containing protein [Planctomycetales bacterium]
MAEQATTSPPIALKGGADLSQVQGIYEQISNTMRDSTDITIDCSELDFIDGSTLQVLLAAKAALTSAGGSLKLADPPYEVESLLQTAGAADLLQ